MMYLNKSFKNHNSINAKLVCVVTVIPHKPQT